VPTPDADRLAELLGDQLPSSSTVERLEAVLRTVKAMASSYTRGNGFTEGVPAEDLEAVIYSAAMRWVSNPSQIPMRQQLGAVAVDLRGGFIGWTLVELAVLNNYRDRAL
jgi:hypothetical protein